MEALYEANDNYQNYILIREFDRGEKDTLICDWDLSKEEIDIITEKFYKGEYGEKNCADVKPEWITFNEAQKMFNEIKAL